MQWISIKEKYPENGKKVMAKFWDRKTQKEYELETTFTDHEDYRSWNIKMPEGAYIISLPQQWREI